MENIRLLIFDWEGTLMSMTQSLFPGVKEMLVRLKSNYSLAIATNRGRQSLDRLLTSFQMDDLFETSRCADECAPKPDPQMAEEILDELSMSVDQAIMIGDSESDMVMAEKIGMARIAIGQSSYINELLRHHPVAAFDNVIAVEAYLSQYLKH